jgi:tRNA 2-selenouridine synthase
MVNKISCEEAFKLDNAIFIDTRSPAEYEDDHIIGAVSLPILDDQERHEVGLMYKQISQELAIEKGLKFYSNKIPNIVKIIQPHKDKTIVVYCARGGMRSGIIASLLESIGMKVYQVEGGYKLFRNYLLEQLNNFKIKPKVYVVHGLTCTGKTDLLKKFDDFIDLEGLAQHRGSLYGAIGLKPHSQKKFENLLLARLRELNGKDYVLVEGESRRIGNCIMPECLWKAMDSGENIMITRTVPLRCSAMVKEYFLNPKIAEEIKEISKKLRRTISNKNKEEMIRLMEDKEYEKAAEILLTKYYDPLYEHTLNKMKFSLTINNDEIDKAVIAMKKYLSDSK